MLILKKWEYEKLKEENNLENSQYTECEVTLHIQV